MRTLLLISVLATVVVRGGEANAPTMRQKLRAKITASAPPAPPPKQSADQKPAEETAAPPVLQQRLKIGENSKQELRAP